MIAGICLLAPPVIMACLREKFMEKQWDKQGRILNYALSVLLLNFLMLLILYFGFHNKDNLYGKLNQYNDFALKYIFLSLFIAAAEPAAECFFRKKVAVKIDLSRKPKDINWRLAAGTYAIILFSLNAVRIFDHNFWADEAFTIQLVKNKIPGLIAGTAADVHPPLYYLIVKAFYSLFGDKGVIFHLVSLIPCAVILILALTLIWKRFGREVSAVLITLSCLSGNAVRFNVEVRMYSWGALFILLTFYEFCCIVGQEKKSSYVLFVVFSLMASYTHYYCLLSVSFFYLALLFLALYKRRLSWKKVLASCMGAIAGYLPWFFVALQSMLSRVDNYWIESIPSWRASVSYLFSGKFGILVWGIFGIGGVTALLYETRVLDNKKTEDGRRLFSVSFDRIVFSDIAIILIVGPISVFGTILSAILISYFVRPFYTLRYIYPVSIVMWMILGIVISRLKGRKVYIVLALIYMLTVFGPAYHTTYTKEREQNERFEETLKLTAGVIRQGDVILTNVPGFAWTVGGIYYPDIAVRGIGRSLDVELEKDLCYWLVVERWKEIPLVFQELKEKGFSYELIIMDGNMGSYDTTVYKVTADDR